MIETVGVCQEQSGQTLRLNTESADGRSRLEVTFLGVVDLQVSWPHFVPAQLDVIDIRDVDAHQLEHTSYRVAEGEGFFAFWCRDFFAVVTRDD
ncbi:hypothetical protein OHA70_02660 [Kribbella sp. NBC_00382]|uniref:hypothetical protein n=1 Tax=Kribbella sp. NBC_00382 TaxID=2975967 RepID=UPI002E1ABD3A